MKFVIDENVSYSVVDALASLKHTTISIAKEFPSISDKDVYEKVVEEQAILITRDYHFTNPVSFPSEYSAGVIDIRPGNLTASEEVRMVLKFLRDYKPENIRGALVTLYKGSIKIRSPRREKDR